MDDIVELEVTVVVRYAARPTDGYALRGSALPLPEQMRAEDAEAYRLGAVTVEDVLTWGQIASVTFRLVSLPLQVAGFFRHLRARSGSAFPVMMGVLGGASLGVGLALLV